MKLGEQGAMLVVRVGDRDIRVNLTVTLKKK
jgi:hypothetical protein